MSVNVKAAVRASLAAYLLDYLAADYPTLQVLQKWPTPGKALPEVCISIVAPGGDEESPFAPEVVAVTPGLGVDGEVTYSTGLQVLGLQLDCWTRFSAVRDALAGAVWSALNRHPLDTLDPEAKPHLGAQRGLVIPVTDLYNTPCDFRFDPVSDVVETSDNAQQGEWRATWQGTATVHALVRETLPLIQQVTITFDVD